MTHTTLDIILPCYNPAAEWKHHIISGFREITGVLPDVQARLILVNDGSLRGITPADVEELKAAIPDMVYIAYAKNMGKGFALREGVKLSDAMITIYTDVDFPYTTASFLKIFTALKHDTADVAAGVKDAAYYVHVPPFRRFISRLLRACTATVLRLKVSDTQCGLKGFNAKGRAQFMRTTIDRYLFDLEFIFLASRNASLRTIPVDITLRENVQFSSMRMGILLQESGNFLKILIRSIFA